MSDKTVEYHVDLVDDESERKWAEEQSEAFKADSENYRMFFEKIHYHIYQT